MLGGGGRWCWWWWVLALLLAFPPLLEFVRQLQLTVVKLRVIVFAVRSQASNIKKMNDVLKQLHHEQMAKIANVLGVPYIMCKHGGSMCSYEL